MKQILRIIAMVSMFVPLWSHAFIYNITVLKKWDKARGRYHYFVGCGDFHDKSHSCTKEQNGTIESLLNRCSSKDVKVLLEDLSSPSSTGSMTCGSYTINSRGGILGGLTQKCSKMGLSAENIEYRYCRVVSLSPALRNLSADPRTLPSVRGTKLASIADEIDAVVSEVKKYNDGDVLNRYYRSGIKEIKNKLQKLKLSKNGKVGVADFLNATTNKSNRLAFIKWMLTFDSGLLDLRMAHSTVNAMDKQKVVAFAGGSHIKRTSEILQKCGYKKVYSSDEQYQREYDVKKCLGSHIVKGKFCVKPHPVDLKVLSKFL